jgi:hypothetical protein
MADVRLRRIAHLAAALLVVTAQAGCGQPNTDVKLLGLHCVPTKAASGWRVDVFVKLQIASLADAPLRIEDEQFTLVASAGACAARAGLPRQEAPACRLQATHQDSR